jgi:hypothetical protein
MLEIIRFILIFVLILLITFPLCWKSLIIFHEFMFFYWSGKKIVIFSNFITVLISSLFVFSVLQLDFLICNYFN